jgi:DegV family protein with EDD domain
MSKIGIVTDSTCDLPPYLIEQHAIEVVPCLLIVDGKEYADGSGMSRDEFYRRLPTWKRLPTTAAPSIGEFSRRYETLLNAGCDHVLSIHAAGALTSILGTAEQAARDFAGRVTTLDSRSLSLGLGFQVLAVAEASEQGLAAARAAVESTRRRLRLFAVLDTLEYVRRSGRAPAALTMLGNMLSIKPLIEVTDGQVKTIGAVRTTRQANERMLGFMRQGGKLERLAILHTNAEQRAREFLQAVMMEMNRSMPRDILLVNVTTVIGTHVGPNGLGFAAIRQ